MKISFHGACQEVTGSCHFVDTGKTKFVVDCGMFQGSEFAHQSNYQPFGFNPAEVDFLILTHAHLDHCGRLPKLVKEGFKGKIYATAPTKEFVKIILDDAANLIAEEALRHRHQPLFLPKDISPILSVIEVISYRQKKQISEDVKLEFFDAGHILGSAFAVLEIGIGTRKKQVVFSGDLGNPPVPLLKDTEFVNGADVLIMESTYGGRIHEPVILREDMLRDIFSQTIKAGGVLMIPAFALERTQQLLFEINKLVENKKVPSARVYLDSPLAIKATNIYKKFENLFDKESRDLIASGDDLFHFPQLTFSVTSSESKAINTKKQPRVIIAGSGMMNGGRILHHLKRYLSEPINQLLVVGYQAENTLGRQLLDGANTVKIHGERIKVKAKITAIGAYSAHADQPKLLHWVKMMKKPKPKKVFLVHGEYKAALMLADGLKQKLNINATIPEPTKIYEI